MSTYAVITIVVIVLLFLFSAIKILNEYEQAQQEEVRVVRQFKARYEDMLVATSVIMEARWGFTGRGQKQMSFFGGAQPPVAEDVTIGLDEKGFPITKTVIASSFSFEPILRPKSS